jgi:MFS family permease
MTPTDRRNTILITVGESFYGLQGGMVASATVLTVLLQAYGAGARFIGAIGAVETGAILLPQLFGAYIFTSRKRYKRSLILWHYLAILPFLLLMGILTLFADKIPVVLYRWLMLAGLGCSSASLGLVVAAWMDWLAGVFDVGIRGTAMGISIFASAFAGTGGGLIAGWAIGHMAAPYSYATLYIVAYMLAMISISVFARVEDPAVHGEDVRTAPRTRELFARFMQSLRDRDFREYLVARVLATCGFSIMPFVVIHYASESGGSLSGAAIVSCGAAATVGMAAGSLWLGRLGDKRGHRLGVLIGAGLQIVSLLIMIFVSGLSGCVLAYLTAGLCSLGTWVSHSNIVLESCPHDCRIAHISACNLVVGIFGVVTPLLAGLAVDQWGTRPVFAGSAVFSVAAFLWFLLRVEDPRDTTLA